MDMLFLQQFLVYSKLLSGSRHGCTFVITTADVAIVGNFALTNLDKPPKTRRWGGGGGGVHLHFPPAGTPVKSAFKAPIASQRRE